MNALLGVVACIGVSVSSAFAAGGGALPSRWYDVLSQGARGDGVAKDTEAVQQAIDRCGENGGGTVFFGPGTYLCGSLHLRSGVVLWLDGGATIKGSEDDQDYDPYNEPGFKSDSEVITSRFRHALIRGEKVERVAIVGQGTIDGNRGKRDRPKVLSLVRCKYVDIKGVTFRNASFCISLLGSDGINIEGVKILNAYADGISADCCRDVRIANCHIESKDDAVVLKTTFSLGERRATDNVVVTNCLLSTECNGFKIGTESSGDFKRIAVSNCVVTTHEGLPPTGGVCVETVDGGHVDGVVVSNITMRNARAPIFIRLGNRGRDMETPVPGTLKNVIISNITATGATIASTITGIPGHNVENVVLDNIQLHYAGGLPYCSPEEGVPEMEAGYPDPEMFQALPAYGLYCRHVSGLTLSDVQLGYEDAFYRLAELNYYDIKWVTESGIPEPSAPGRPGLALMCEEVKASRVSGLRARPSTGDDAVMRLVNVRDALVQGCMASEGTGTFAEVVGKETARVRFIGNDLSRSAQPFSLIECSPDALVEVANVTNGVGAQIAEQTEQRGEAAPVVRNQEEGECSSPIVERLGKGLLPSGPGSTATNPKDGAQMVWIPAGRFTMGMEGSAIDALWERMGLAVELKWYVEEESPAREVYLDGYWIYKHEVTNQQYAMFVSETGHRPPIHWANGKIPDGLEQHPVVNVSWADAAAYSKWAGVRLPTEAEWEKAARGTDGRIYVWGNEWVPGKCNASGDEDGFEETVAVGSFSDDASPYGVIDMAGNVFEWCGDWAGARYPSEGLVRNPTGPPSGEYRVVRGGSWSATPYACRTTHRHALVPPIRIGNLGFRCAAACNSVSR